MYICSVPIADNQPAGEARKLPLGLCLTVSLTPDSFLPTPDTRSRRTIFNDVKIDVFFNGQLCGSSFVAERHHGKAFEMTRHKVRFSGRKIGRLVEKPWVLVPPGQNADATSREHPHPGGEVYAGAQPRWAAISEALEAEAKRVGRDEFGVFSLLGKHLMTLANLGMPPEVEEMQKAGGPKFGVIDVVVIAGKGHKDDLKHRNLTEPTAFRLNANKPEVRNDFTNARNLTSKESKQFTRNKSRQAGEKTDAEKAIAASCEILRASIESHGHQLQDSLGNTSGTGSFGTVGKRGQVSSSRPDKDYGSSASACGLNNPSSFSRSLSQQDPLRSSNRAESFGRVDKPGQVSSSRPDKHGDLSAYLSEENNPIHSSGSPFLKKYLANHIGDSSWIKSFGPVGKPVQASSSKPDKQYDSSAFPSSRNKPFGFPDFSRSRTRSHQSHRTTGTPSLSIMKELPLGESPSISASYIGRAALVSSGSTSFTGLGLDPNRTEDPSIVQRSKHKKSMPYEYVLDNKMTLSEEFESVRAKAKESQSVEKNALKKELRNPVSMNARASRSGVADRGASTLAGPSKAIDPKGNERKTILKSNPKGGPAPTTPLQIQPITSARASRLVDTVMKDPETTSTGSSLSSLSSSSSFSIMPPSHPAAAPPTRRKLNKSGASTNPRRRFRGIAGPAWDTSWTTPPLSQGSVLTYAPDGLLRSVKLERSGWFKEKDVVMAVRFLVG